MDYEYRAVLLRSSCRGLPLLALALPLALGLPVSAQEAPPPDARSLAELSLEELGNIDITSVLKRPERLSQAAAAIYVITRQDIGRSGATTIPEALRLAPNLQVAQVDSSQYTIGARGLNIANVNKLLVLIDGRTVYTPLFAGVFWDAQDVLLEDIERIEVISGPGGTLWGSNAVNGIINIITRNARDTQGTLITGGGGTRDRVLAGLRHGGTIADGVYYRVYAKYSDWDATAAADGASASDGWHKVQGGFRLDWAGGADALTLGADAYQGAIGQPILDDKRIEGANLLGRWQRTLSPDSNLTAQVYFDRTRRDHPLVFEETLKTYDIDVQHGFTAAERHQIVWGGGYRAHDDEVTNSAVLSFLPAHKELRLANVFAQDSIALVRDRLNLTLGAKLEHNSYTGWEVQPGGRLAWTLDENKNNLLWAAVSRAVRTPSRLDRELFFSTPGFTLAGGPDFRSESVLAYELGYRAQPNDRLALSMSSYYNVYDDVRNVERVAGSDSTYVLLNRMEGETYGAELWGDVVLTDSWRLKTGYAYLHTDFRLPPDSTDPTGVRSAGNDARHRFLLSSALNLTVRLEIDATLRYMGALPDPRVPAYTALDLRLAWRPNQRLEVALIGQDLLDQRHPEFGAPGTRREIEHGALLKAVWTF